MQRTVPRYIYLKEETTIRAAFSLQQQHQNTTHNSQTNPRHIHEKTHLHTRLGGTTTAKKFTPLEDCSHVFQL